MSLNEAGYLYVIRGLLKNICVWSVCEDFSQATISLPWSEAVELLSYYLQRPPPTNGHFRSSPQQPSLPLTYAPLCLVVFLLVGKWCVSSGKWADIMDLYIEERSEEPTRSIAWRNCPLTSERQLLSWHTQPFLTQSTNSLQLHFTLLKGLLTQKRTFCHNLLILISVHKRDKRIVKNFGVQRTLDSTDFYCMDKKKDIV